MWYLSSSGSIEPSLLLMTFILCFICQLIARRQSCTSDIESKQNVLSPWSPLIAMICRVYSSIIILGQRFFSGVIHSVFHQRTVNCILKIKITLCSERLNGISNQGGPSSRKVPDIGRRNMARAHPRVCFDLPPYSLQSITLCVQRLLSKTRVPEMTWGLAKSFVCHVAALRLQGLASWMAPWFQQIYLQQKFTVTSFEGLIIETDLHTPKLLDQLQWRRDWLKGLGGTRPINEEHSLLVPSWWLCR